MILRYEEARRSTLVRVRESSSIKAKMIKEIFQREKLKKTRYGANESRLSRVPSTHMTVNILHENRIRQRSVNTSAKKSEVRKKYSKRGRTIVSFCYFDGIFDGMVSCPSVFYISFPMISMCLRYDNNRCVTIELCFISGSSTIIVGPILSAHVQTTSGRKARVI